MAGDHIQFGVWGNNKANMYEDYLFLAMQTDSNMSEMHYSAFYFNFKFKTFFFLCAVLDYTETSTVAEHSRSKDHF